MTILGLLPVYHTCSLPHFFFDAEGVEEESCRAPKRHDAPQGARVGGRCRRRGAPACRSWAWRRVSGCAPPRGRRGRGAAPGCAQRESVRALTARCADRTRCAAHAAPAPTPAPTPRTPPARALSRLTSVCALPVARLSTSCSRPPSSTATVRHGAEAQRRAAGLSVPADDGCCVVFHGGAPRSIQARAMRAIASPGCIEPGRAHTLSALARCCAGFLGSDGWMPGDYGALESVWTLDGARTARTHTHKPSRTGSAHAQTRG